MSDTLFQSNADTTANTTANTAVHQAIPVGQFIDAGYEEFLIVQLSVAQNGAAMLHTVVNDSGTLAGYNSEYQIDLSGYPALVAAKAITDLKTYATTKRDALINGGISVNIGTAKAPVLVLADTDATGRVNLNGLISMVALNPDFTTVWVQSTGSLELDGDQLKQVAMAVAVFVDQCYRVYSGILADIDSGKITLDADIDAAAWPSTTV